MKNLLKKEMLLQIFFYFLNIYEFEFHSITKKIFFTAGLTMRTIWFLGR